MLISVPGEAFLGLGLSLLVAALLRGFKAPVALHSSQINWLTLFPQEALLYIESEASDAVTAFHSNQQVFTLEKISRFLLIIFQIIFFK